MPFFSGSRAPSHVTTLFLLVLVAEKTTCFTHHSRTFVSLIEKLAQSKLNSQKKQRLPLNMIEERSGFHPFSPEASFSSDHIYRPSPSISNVEVKLEKVLPAAVTSSLAVISINPSTALAAMIPSKISMGDFNPDNFKPVCPASDGFYRFLQGTTEAIVGEDQFVEYGPLIAGGLLRVRLELCVVESFFNEAVGPFIQQNGLNWILPLHETVETFLAGTIFALATTFILVGSTKILTVLITYGDVFLGAPMRLLGGFFFDRARGLPVTLDVGVGVFKKRLVGPPVLEENGGWKAENLKKRDGESLNDILQSFENVDGKQWPLIITSGTVKGAGEGSRILRDLIDSLDLFIGRYLVLIATGYIGLKFIHFKIFPDFPPF